MPRLRKNAKRSPRRFRARVLVALLSLGVAGVCYALYQGLPSMRIVDHWADGKLTSGAAAGPSDREAPLDSAAIPPETVWMIAPEKGEADMPEALRSRRPVVRLLRRPDGIYEMYYWGNPIRPAYVYSVKAVGYDRTALRDENGNPEETRPLPVTVPIRADGKLPLQPVVPLVRLDGGTESDYAVRICIRDAATGAVLCYSNYLLENPPKPAKPADGKK